MPRYDGYYVNYIVHSNRNGIFDEAIIDESFREKHVVEAEIRIKKGDHVETFKGANNAIGTLFLHFNTHEELEAALSYQKDWLKLHIL